MSIRHGGEPCIHRSRTLAMKPSRFSVISRMTPTGVNAVEFKAKDVTPAGKGPTKGPFAIGMPGSRSHGWQRRVTSLCSGFRHKFARSEFGRAKHGPKDEPQGRGEQSLPE